MPTAESAKRRPAAGNSIFQSISAVYAGGGRAVAAAACSRRGYLDGWPFFRCSAPAAAAVSAQHGHFISRSGCNRLSIKSQLGGRKIGENRTRERASERAAAFVLLHCRTGSDDSSIYGFPIVSDSFYTCRFIPRICLEFFSAIPRGARG